MSGLYVDMTGGVLREPPMIDGSEARMVRVGLRIDLEALFRLPTFLENDEMWSELDRTPVDAGREST